MARRRRKKIVCPNCGTRLNEQFNFCPNCGQENTDTNVKFQTLVGDFFTNYLSWDSRFGRTIRPFFTRPGRITKAFAEGKRMSFAHPIRWYLLISFFHFFFFVRFANSLADPVVQVASLDEEKLDQILDEVDSVQEVEARQAIDSLRKYQNQVGFYDGVVKVDMQDSTSDWPLSNEKEVLMKRLVDEDYAVSQIMDSLDVDHRPAFDRFVIRQIVKFNKSGQEEFILFFLKQIPIVMFIILPLVALLFKVFHWKEKYIYHLVHALHTHSFAFFILGVYWAINYFHRIESSSLLLWILFGIWIYIYFSYKNVYELKWGRALFKFSVITFCYNLLLAFGTLITILLTVLTF